MWKKEIIFGVIVVCLSILAFVGYKQIKERSLFETTDLYSVVSAEAVLIIETRNAIDFTKALLYRNDLFKIVNEEKFLPEFTNLIEKIDVLLTKDAELESATRRQSLIAYSIHNDSWKELIATRLTAKDARKAIEIIREIFFPNKKTERIRYNGVQIHVFSDSIGNKKFACAFVKGIFLCSSHLSEIKKAIDVFSSNDGSLNANSAFMSIRNTAGRNVLANIFVNTQAVFPLLSEKINDNFASLRSKLNSFSDWIALDLSVSDNQLLVNGYSNRMSTCFTDVFENQTAVRSNFYNYIPLNTCFFVYYGISDFSAFREKIREIQGATTSPRSESFVKEHFSGNLVSGFVSLNNMLKQSNYVMFSIKDSASAAAQLNLIATKKTTHHSSYSHQQIIVYELPAQFQITVPFGDFAALQGREYAAITSGYMVVTTSPDLLVELTGLIAAGYTLSRDRAFLSAERSYGRSSTVLAYVHFPSLLKYVNEIFSTSFAEKLLRHKDKLSHVQTIGWQMENERGQIYHNAFIRSKSANDVPDSAIVIPKRRANRLIWSVDFPSKPVFGPVIVRNYVTGTNEILVQDTNNKLHLYTHDGNLMWSAQISAPIMGANMHQLDYYKNRRYQFIFNTAKRMYLVDRKGRFVERYPITLPVEASAPLAVFDYENNKDYRIFIPGKNRRIYLFRKDGTSPPDWRFGQTAGVVLNPIQHMRVDGRDYLIVNDGNSPLFLNRQGRERITLKSAVDISRNNVFLLPRIRDERAAFVTTDKQGNVKRINVDGTVRSIKPDEPSSLAHHFMLTQVARSPVYIFVDGNVVSIYNHNMNRIFVRHFDEIDLIPILFNNYLAVYSEASNNVRIFNLNELDVAEQFFSVGSKPSIGRLKPMPNNYVVTYSNGRLVCYDIN